MSNIQEFSSKRIDQEFQVNLDGETYTLRPVKKTKVQVEILKDRDEDGMGGTRALLTWFERGLNRDHHPSKRGPGHEEYVEGCQACRLVARLDDEDDPLEIETVSKAASWLMGEISDRPTGSPSA